MAGRGGKRSTSWKPGQSGNPKGPPKGLTDDIRQAARQYTPEALAALAKALDSKGERVHAASVLLDRAYGKPTQTQQTQQLDRDGNPTDPVPAVVALIDLTDALAGWKAPEK